MEAVFAKVISAKCGDIIESTGFLSTGGNAIVYSRTCTCCGDGCNGHQMDEKCLGEPVTNHKCWSDSVVNSNALPKTARQIDCTESQACSVC